MIIPTESKIQIVDRLRRSGCWNEAKTFLDRTRKELRRQGIARRDAKESAWELLASQYPAHTRQFVSAMWLVAAEMPPQECLSGPNAGRFELLWRVFFRLLSADAFLDESDCSITEETDTFAARFQMANTIALAKTPLERFVAFRAIQNPDAFLDDAYDLFSTEAERLQDSDDSAFFTAIADAIPEVSIRLVALQRLDQFPS